MRWAAGKKGACRFARRPAEPSYSPHMALDRRDNVNMSNPHPEKQRRRNPNDTHGRQPQHGERSSLRRALQRSSARRGHWRATTRSTPGAHGRERTHTQPWDARTRARDLRHPPTPGTHQDTPAPIRAASSPGASAEAWGQRAGGGMQNPTTEARSQGGELLHQVRGQGNLPAGLHREQSIRADLQRRSRINDGAAPRLRLTPGEGNLATRTSPKRTTASRWRARARRSLRRCCRGCTLARLPTPRPPRRPRGS